MSAEIPANSGVIFDFNQVQPRMQTPFKGFAMEELCSAMQGFMQKISIPNISQSIKIPSVLEGKMPSIFGGKGGGKGMGG